jgi:hypothetical protein
VGVKMPAIVKTPADEKKWARAKQQVHKQYPDLKESDKRFWQICMTVFKNMKGGK